MYKVITEYDDFDTETIVEELNEKDMKEAFELLLMGEIKSIKVEGLE